jgi:hypothetical protein
MSVLPEFERVPFEVPRRGGIPARANEYLQAIVRKPIQETEVRVPVGVVSRNYRLVQHKEVIQAIAATLAESGIDAANLYADVSLTTYGERMALSVYLPDEERFRFQLGANDGMRLRIECFNSVDRSTKLVAMIGWYRFVCANGLIVGETVTSLRGAHSGQLQATDVGAIVRQGMRQADRERALYNAWRNQAVEAEQLRGWVDEALRKKWGVRAAARTYAICLTGQDAVLTDPFEQSPPSQRKVAAVARVPGAPACAANAMDVAQALAWVAGRRSELGSRIQRTVQIVELIGHLIESTAA